MSFLLKTVSAFLLASTVISQPASIPHAFYPLSITSNDLQVPKDGTTQGDSVPEVVIRVPNVDWLRVEFDMTKTKIVGDTIIKITSELDGFDQTFSDMESLQLWKGTSAYFNGNAVKVQLFSKEPASKSSSKSFFAITGLVINDPNAPTDPPSDDSQFIESLCSETDRRVYSKFRRDGRLMPVGCTAWIINDAQNCMLTAGHCRHQDDKAVVQFQVPLSGDDGKVRHPKPKNQYPVDPASIQSSQEPRGGDDWMYFGTFANPETNLTAYKAQKSRYKLFKKDLIATNATLDELRISGYGVSAIKTLTQVQKVHSGKFNSFEKQNNGFYLLKHQVDTTGGNSGSAILDLKSGRAVGIHTNGGCTPKGGSNFGTLLSNSNLKKALKNPLGVCKKL